MLSGNQPSRNVETLIYRKLDIHILIRKGLCATIVAKRDMLRQTVKDDYWWIMSRCDGFQKDIFLQGRFI